VSTIDPIAVLKRVPIFSGLGQTELAALANLAIARNVRAGEFVFWEGDAPAWFYVLAAGRIKVLKHTSSGKEVIVAFFGPGEMFGEVGIFADKPYPASAQADTDVAILAIKKADFLSFFARNPQVALAIINILGSRLRTAQSRLKDLAGERAEQRLAHTLHMLSARLGADLPFTRQNIADMSGTTPETAIRVLSRLSKAGIIRSSRGMMTVLNARRLQTLAEGPPAA